MLTAAPCIWWTGWSGICWKNIPACSGKNWWPVILMFITRQEVAGAIEEIEQLAHQGLLFAGDPLGGAWEPPGHRIVKALCLHLAHYLQLEMQLLFCRAGLFSVSLRD